jgi:1,4-alpha-glucan branching enzyme
VPVPCRGTWTEILNTEKDIYDGCNMCNFKPLRTHSVHEPYRFPQKITIRLAPFAAVWFVTGRKQN